MNLEVGASSQNAALLTVLNKSDSFSNDKRTSLFNNEIECNSKLSYVEISRN